MEGSQATQEARIGAKRPPRWLARLAWIVIPVVVFAAAHRAVRASVDRAPRWYDAADILVAEGPVDVLLIGSSRTAAAVHMDTFETVAADLTGRPIRGLNLALGGSSLGQHYLGLRNLLERHPENLRGVHLFIESTCGASEGVGWGEGWTLHTLPWMLTETIRVGDLPRYWRTTGHSVEDRLMITARVFLHRFPVVARRERFREWATTQAGAWVLQDVLPWMRSLRVRDSTKRMRRLRHGPARLPVLSQPFGEDVRWWDALAHVDARLLKVRREDMYAALASRPRDAGHRLMERSVQESIVALIAAAGGQPYFYEIPTSTVLCGVYDGPVHADNRRVFGEWVAARGLPHLKPRFQSSDRTMSDLSHLNPDQAPEFTTALARAWVDSGRVRTVASR
jgi:hypothetical protein